MRLTHLLLSTFLVAGATLGGAITNAPAGETDRILAAARDAVAFLLPRPAKRASARVVLLMPPPPAPATPPEAPVATAQADPAPVEAATPRQVAMRVFPPPPRKPERPVPDVVPTTVAAAPPPPPTLTPAPEVRPTLASAIRVRTVSEPRALGYDTMAQGLPRAVHDELGALGRRDHTDLPCRKMARDDVVFCIEDVAWPAVLEPYLRVKTDIMRGTKAVVRYDDGAVSRIHTLFPADSFDRVVAHFTRRLGAPNGNPIQVVAPLSEPRLANPTAVWRHFDDKTRQVTTLEIRKMDDVRDGYFPDERHGAIMLYRSSAKPIFTSISTVELSILNYNL